MPQPPEFSMGFAAWFQRVRKLDERMLPRWVRMYYDLDRSPEVAVERVRVTHRSVLTRMARYGTLGNGPKPLKGQARAIKRRKSVPRRRAMSDAQARRMITQETAHAIIYACDTCLGRRLEPATLAWVRSLRETAVAARKNS